MVYILGRFFENGLTIRKALTSLHGVSSNSKNCFKPPPAVPNGKPSPARLVLLARILAKHHIHPTATLGTLSTDTLTRLTETLSDLTIENHLRRKVQADIERLRDMGSYRGRRHMFHLPVRGQITKSQIKTAKKLNSVPRRLGMSTS